MLRITHPRPMAGRQTAFQVDFRDGVAHVDTLHPERARALTHHGFTIEDDEFVDLETLTVAQLRKQAEKDGVVIPAKAKRAEIIDILSRQPAAPIADPLGTQIAGD